MRIPCPYCGNRDLTEFTYLGDAAFARPDPGAPDAPQRFYEAVYLRDNPAGPHDELWYHGAGCRSWLKVTRDTRTHAVLGAIFATPAPATGPALTAAPAASGPTAPASDS